MSDETPEMTAEMLRTYIDDRDRYLRVRKEYEDCILDQKLCKLENKARYAEYEERHAASMFRVKLSYFLTAVEWIVLIYIAIRVTP